MTPWTVNRRAGRRDLELGRQQVSTDFLAIVKIASLRFSLFAFDLHFCQLVNQNETIYFIFSRGILLPSFSGSIILRECWCQQRSIPIKSGGEPHDENVFFQSPTEPGTDVWRHRCANDQELIPKGERSKSISGPRFGSRNDFATGVFYPLDSAVSFFLFRRWSEPAQLTGSIPRLDIWCFWSNP